jgi:3-isopropylmalate dehydrogenase
VIEDAVDAAISDGCRTGDLGGKLGTRQMTEEIVRRLDQEISEVGGR